jgi:hypothetical protein
MTVHAAVTGPQKATASNVRKYQFWNVCMKSQGKYSGGAKIKYS